MASRQRKKGGKPEAKPAPAQQETAGRDKKTGQFLPGFSGNPAGQKPGINLKQLALREMGEDELGVGMVRVLRKLMQMAVDLGDVQAAKLLFDRLCDKDAQQINANVTLTDTERIERLKAIMASADARCDEE